MKRHIDIEGLIARVWYRGDAAARERIQGRLDDAWRRRTPVPTRMTAALSRVAMAASVVLAIGVLGVLLTRSGGPVYALDQTLDAIRDIRFFHFRLLTGSDRPNREAWVEYDPNGSIRNVRVNYYDSNAVAVWSDGITQYWSPDIGELAIFEDSEYTDKILYFVGRHDPRQAITYLEERGRDAGIDVSIDQPKGVDDPVTVTVVYEPNTYLIGKPMPRMRELFRIDPVTKWITRVEVERLDQDRYLPAGVWEYVDYNRPFDPGTFDLKTEAGAEVKVCDTTGIDMGVGQGGLSDEEVAVRLVQDYLDAWAAKDYDSAAKLFRYISLRVKDDMVKMLGRKDFQRVVSLGSPVRAEPPVLGWYVPAEVEYEENGHRTVVTFRVHVSPYAEGRWCIRDLDNRP